MRLRGICFAAIAALTTVGSAQVTSVVPNGYDVLNGGGTFLGPLANAGRTYQWLIRADQLTQHVGRILKGFALRVPSGTAAAWPTADVTYSTYDIRLSDSVLPANRSLTFANNVAGPQKLVRSGPLTIPANSYGFGSTPNPFGPIIAFQSGYYYGGGNLLIELRHNGFTGTSRSIDAILATNGPPGVYAQQVSACWTGSYTGTSGSQGNFGVLQLTSEPDPPILPEGYEVNFGFEVSGNLNSLFISDDDCLGVFPDETTLIAEIEFYGTTNLVDLSDLSILIEASVARYGLAQSISMRDYQHSNWTEVDGRVAPTTDTTIEVTLTNAAHFFLGPNGALRARITWQPINDEDPSQDGWLHCVDRVRWLAH